MASNTSFASNKPFKPPRPSVHSSVNNNAPVLPPSSPPDSDAEPSATQDAASSQSHPTIPSALLSRLVHDHFKNTDTRITKEAMSIIEKYIETFAKEAVVRAVLMKREQAKDGKDDGFLEVEDLERIVLQLLLDF